MRVALFHTLANLYNYVPYWETSVFSYLHRHSIYCDHTAWKTLPDTCERMIVKNCFDFWDPPNPPNLKNPKGSCCRLSRQFLGGEVGREVEDTFWFDSPHFAHLPWPTFGIKHGANRVRCTCTSCHCGCRKAACKDRWGRVEQGTVH